jgi:poly(A) polymerase
VPEPKPNATPRTLADLRQRLARALTEVSPVALDLGSRFAAAGHELALVGGPVRDAALGRVVADLDLTTDAPPLVVMELLTGWADALWDVGVAFGTVGARRGDVHVEITTYRSESYDLDSRKPAVAFGTSLAGDLGRRDFTVNSMAVRLPDLVFVDPYGGLSDLAAGRLRTPNSPAKSFSDDPLRMMRAARFVSQLEFSVDDEVVAAMTAMADRLDIVSAERVRDELTKLVLGRNPRGGLELLVSTGLADRVLPELPKLRLEIDEHHRHKDVFEHSLTVLDQAIDLESGHEPSSGPDLVLRLAALLHDIGKPRTRRFEGDGRVSFHHHEVVGAAMVRKRLRALRFSSHEVAAIGDLVELHLRFHGYGTGEWTDSAVRRYVRDAGPLLSRLHKLTRADCTTRNRRKATTLARTYDHLEERIAKLSAEEELAAIRPTLDGNAIMRILDLPPGPMIGKAYRYLLEVRLDDGPLSEPDARRMLLDWWAINQPG